MEGAGGNLRTGVENGLERVGHGLQMGKMPTKLVIRVIVLCNFYCFANIVTNSHCYQFILFADDDHRVNDDPPKGKTSM